MERFLYRLQSPASNTPTEPTDAADLLASALGIFHMGNTSQQTNPAKAVTVAVLDLKLQTLLQDLTSNIAKEVGRIVQELRGEIDQLRECTATLENKFDETVQYMHALEEENAFLKHTVSQIQLQQEDLENRERRSNVQIRGVHETVNDKELRAYLLNLFVTLAPHIPDVDWLLDRAHRSLTPKPPPGSNPRDIIVRFHYYDSKEALTAATRNKNRIGFKGSKIQIFSDLSPITLAKRCNLHPVTAHLQLHQIPYRCGFPFRLSASKDGTQYSIRDLHECEAFTRNLGLPPVPDEELQLPPPALASKPLQAPAAIWTPVLQRQQKAFSKPQRSNLPRPPT